MLAGCSLSISLPGIYPSTFTNISFVKKIELYKGKTNCKVIVIAAWDLRQSLCGVSRSKARKTFWLFNIFKTIKRLTIVLKKLYSWSKKLYQCINNLFFLTNIPTPARVQYQVESNLTYSCLRSWH